MKKHLPTLAILGASLLFTPSLFAQKRVSLKDHPAYLDIDAALDLKTVKPTVNVNLPRFLLNSALSEFNGGQGDPLAKVGINLQELTGDLKLIRVLVFEDSGGQEEAFLKGVASLQATLEADWTPIISIPEDRVHIYARSDETGEEMAGLAFLVADEGEAVIANVVGNISIGKIAKVAALIGSAFVPAEVMEQLATLTGASVPREVSHEHEEHLLERGHVDEHTAEVDEAVDAIDPAEDSH